MEVIVASHDLRHVTRPGPGLMAASGLHLSFSQDVDCLCLASSRPVLVVVKNLDILH